MKRLTQNLFLSALLISLFLHVSAGTVVYFKKSLAKPDRSVEVVLVDKPAVTIEHQISKEKIEVAKQIVDQGEKRVNDEVDPKAKFLSRFDQRLAEQTRADKTGRFQNDAKQGPAAKVNKENQKPHEEKKLAQNAPKTKERPMETSDTGDVALPKMADLKPQFHWDKTPTGVENPGPVSQSDDFLKDLKTGPQTLLSTREFVYYTYYSRIKDRLRIFWEPKIREKINRIFATGRHIASDEEKITRLVITLDVTGKLIRVQVLGESGLKDLDDAAIEAFQQAAPFPNPPKGIVEPDGTIKIRWDFVLEA